MNAGFNDVYTQHANTLNNGYDGLYPFATIPNNQVAPWEWYDSLATVAGAQAVGVLNGGAIFHNAVLDNPGMSKARALAYIDTIMGYLNPRIVYCLNIATSIQSSEAPDNTVEIFPNPASYDFIIKTTNQNEMISSFEICDITGKSVIKIENINSSFLKINRESIRNGIYFVKIGLEKQIVIRKIILN
jgi:hypothetical protein